MTSKADKRPLPAPSQAPFSPLVGRAPTEEFVPEMQTAVKRAKVPSAPGPMLTLVLTPTQDHYCGYAIQEAHEDYAELPTTSGVERVNKGFAERCDKVVVYCDQGVTPAMRELISHASKANKPVELRLLGESNHRAWSMQASQPPGRSLSSASGSGSVAESSSGKST